MAQSRSSRREPDDNDELSYGAWFAFWAQLVVLGFLAIIGAFYASADAQPGDYTCGLILSIAAIVLALLRIKARFDGNPLGWASFLFVD